MALQDKLKTFANPVIGDLEIAAERTAEEARALAKGYKSPVFPEFSTGARAKLLINGKTIGAALQASYSVSASVTEVRTIDQFLPWEIVPGQVTIKANLRRIVNPNRTLGGDALFTTMQAYLHQPYASLEIRDRLGNLQFYAKGMFTDLQCDIQAGQLTVEGVTFVGYSWRENVNQEFSVYRPGGFVDAVKKRFSQNSLVKQVSSILG